MHLRKTNVNPACCSGQAYHEMYVTDSLNRVTCKSCKRTKMHKDLVSLALWDAVAAYNFWSPIYKVFARYEVGKWGQKLVSRAYIYSGPEELPIKDGALSAAVCDAVGILKGEITEAVQ